MMRYRGFTLLEVLIALAVVSIALLALAGSGSRQLRTQADLQERTLALWVADNVIAEQRLSRDQLSPGRFQGVRPMGRHDWHWELLVQPSPEPSIWRLDVVVHSDEDRNTPVLRQTGFVRAP